MAEFGFRQVPARDKAGYVLRHFDSIARKYDFMNTLLSFGLHHLWKKWAVDSLGLKPGDRVLDVCGGTADLAIRAARRVGPRGQVFLYDINREMMAVGKEKVARASLAGRVDFIQGDAEALCLPAERFDAALVGYGIRNLTRMERGLQEMVRALKPGGKFLCLEFSAPASPPFRALYDFYSFHLMPLVGEVFAGTRQAYLYLPESIRRFPAPEALCALLERTGLCRVSFRRLTNGISVIYLGVKPE